MTPDEQGTLVLAVDHWIPLWAEDENRGSGHGEWRRGVGGRGGVFRVDDVIIGSFERALHLDDVFVAPSIEGTGKHNFILEMYDIDELPAPGPRFEVRSGESFELLGEFVLEHCENGSRGQAYGMSDLNGDGVNEIAFAITLDDAHHVDCGAVYIYDITSSTVLWKLEQVRGRALPRLAFEPLFGYDMLEAPIVAGTAGGSRRLWVASCAGFARPGVGEVQLFELSSGVPLLSVKRPHSIEIAGQ